MTLDDVHRAYARPARTAAPRGAMALALAATVALGVALPVAVASRADAPSAQRGPVASGCAEPTGRGWLLRPEHDVAGNTLAAHGASSGRGGPLLQGRSGVLVGAWAEGAETATGPTLALRRARPLIASITAPGVRVTTVVPRVVTCSAR